PAAMSRGVSAATSAPLSWPLPPPLPPAASGPPPFFDPPQAVNKLSMEAMIAMSRMAPPPYQRPSARGRRAWGLRPRFPKVWRLLHVPGPDTGLHGAKRGGSHANGRVAGSFVADHSRSGSPARRHRRDAGRLAAHAGGQANPARARPAGRGHHAGRGAGAGG